MLTIIPRNLQGFRDHSGSQMDRRRAILTTFERAVRLYGFQPLETPAIEYREVIAPHADQTEKLIYGFIDHGGREVALKYDLTVPTARFAAQHWHELPQPYRRYQFQPVWRADRPGKGRYREFLQFDFDTYGSANTLYDAEVLLIVNECLTAVDLPPFTIRLNHRQILTGLLQVAEVPAVKHVSAIRCLDKLNKIGTDGVRRELEASGFSLDAVDCLLNSLSSLPNGDALVTLCALRRLFRGKSQGGLDGVDEIASVVDGVHAYGLRQNVVRLWPTLARGLDYYTGPIHEVVIDQGGMGSVCGGGRYDGLFLKFSDLKVPATGSSLGVERIIDILNCSGAGPVPEPSPQVLFCATEREQMLRALKLARTLHSVGLAAEVFLHDATLKKQLKYADKRNIPITVLFNQYPANSDSHLAVRDMGAGSQKEIQERDLTDCVTTILGRK